MAAKPTGAKTSQSDIIASVADLFEFSTSKMKEIIVAYQDEIKRQLAMGNNVATDLGTFMRADKAAGTARNPRTGEKIATVAKSGARFKVGSGLKKFLNT